MSIVETLKCPSCGGVIHAKISTCSFCGNPLEIVRHSNLKVLSSVSEFDLNNKLKTLDALANQTYDDVFEKGQVLFNLKRFNAAKEIFSICTSFEPEKSEPYFYLALCSIAGKKPFLRNRSEIDSILAFLKTSIKLKNEDDLVRFFYAYVLQDYFERKHFIVSEKYESYLIFQNPKEGTINTIMLLCQHLHLEIPDYLIEKIKVK
jgi:tetratricopeptide (TPR) repeat protein